jgi:hypothetical protein
MNFTNKIFDSLHYIPVARKNIDTIEIYIRNHLGDPAYFTNGEVVVKLKSRFNPGATKGGKKRKK